MTIKFFICGVYYSSVQPKLTYFFVFSLDWGKLRRISEKEQFSFSFHLHSYFLLYIQVLPTAIESLNSIRVTLCTMATMDSYLIEKKQNFPANFLQIEGTSNTHRISNRVFGHHRSSRKSI